MEATKDILFDFRVAATGLATHKRQHLLFTVFGVVLGFLSLLILPGTYRVTASFYPQSTQSSPSAADLLRGVASGALGGLGNSALNGANAEIYPDLLSSQRILAASLSATRPSTRKTYYIEFGFRGSDSTHALERAVAWMRKSLDVSVNQIDGMVTVSLSHDKSDLASAYLGELLTTLVRFNTEVRKTQAGSVRSFLAERIVTARKELEEAEGALIQFRSSNLRFANSPRLALEQARLEREVRLSETLYQGLCQQYELAKVDEARDTPSITIVDPPGRPSLREGPSLLARIVMGICGCLAVSALWSVRSAWGLIPST